MPDNEPIIDKPRPWRTRPCRHFQLGRCKLGDSCHFAHVLDEGAGASAPPPAAGSTSASDGVVTRQHRREASEANIKDYAHLFQRDATPTSASALSFSSSPPASAHEGRDLLPTQPCVEWSRTGHCENGAWCRYIHSGSGFIGELTDASLTEETVEGACEDLREKIRGGSVNTHIDDDDDDDDDDVEIVTMDTRSVPPRRSSS